ncbi:hypothetical protein Poli38472_007289 [Pythium oligandrum]|uniref:Heme haloperoxidase family profile domain-containing protein n=1 Tax=Pythium oligandrum TaxID=41045 RepID=A0A8K1FFM5_PYTOL|nr:hypothetical protein Poli38472_007289 [Pythium oligandrum]|eukprot:TMW59144.1 hypothetical protein Poli38472_007289 [Pythium oligandrum]
MVSMYIFAIAVAGLISTTEAIKGDAIATLPVGEYYRPRGKLVSRRVDATTAFLRSPCPALNSLANHGYLLRDDMSISKAQIKEAAMKYFNVADDIVNFLTDALPDTLYLNFISKHGYRARHLACSRRRFL